MLGYWFVIQPQCIMPVSIHSLSQGVGGEAYVFGWAVQASELVYEVFCGTGVALFYGVGHVRGSSCEGLGWGVYGACVAAGAFAWMGASGQGVTLTHLLGFTFYNEVTYVGGAPEEYSWHISSQVLCSDRGCEKMSALFEDAIESV